ncbi:leucine-rich repeat-containing protein kinase family protein [Vibrio crassostreae]|uniref:leucine-rich repeat-containing protein kinase family protein n=1 Tax=Vibrio crassostreae TaxID=246167 RepID=UPI000F47935C|nr:leucine-rich repeat-containing protein kinase family protein [Vibrio crassostreae]ROO57321.1 leucine rich repeat (LRR) protein [Vibrio crassostreae]ROO64587.1 leucine rich repeat (LRR) protein [Vibrio crassostreae]ROO74877.1 leucine rich repeat (LRR) protein [Vibrio crassostreae]ROO77471.1 leucine rich repeat (LRR) protein [Vibrio crassostreae]ROR69839.1 leucine rich repeat (LRR) protein [Vibrio crassostreae]
MHTLEQLKSGQLKGIKRLKLSEGLTEFPLEILELSDSLEILDLSGNQLSELPQELAQLTNLRIIFASNNLFTHLPDVLGSLPKLEMIGFKTNQIKTVSEESLPAQLRWLILTDNAIEVLPNSLGERPKLQKLALAGNQLRALPESMEDLSNLELVRLSANQLTEFPEFLIKLPKLAWLAFAGNPFCKHPSSLDSVPAVSSQCYSLNQVLGQGASGVISHANWLNSDFDFPQEVAVKVFKGEVTSDGYPHDELEACLQAGHHSNLVKSIAQVDEQDYLALVMELIPSCHYNLGLPPTLDTCTRDTFPEGFELPIAQIDNIVTQMIDVFNHLHDNKVCHGDLYAHNTLVNEQGQMIFGDFGAATIYGYLTEEQQQGIRRIEARALKCFIEDLLTVCSTDDVDSELYKELENYHA